MFHRVFFLTLLELTEKGFGTFRLLSLTVHYLSL